MADPTEAAPHLTDDGLLLEDGGLVAWPSCDGSLRRLDPGGRPVETIRPDDPDYRHWLSLFPLDEVEVEYTVTYRTTLRLPKGRYQLDNELACLTPPEDACHERVGGIAVTRVVRNGREP